MSDEQVQKKILGAIEKLARYDLRAWKQVGAGVQTVLIGEIASLEASQRIKDRSAVIAVCEAALSPEIEGSSWSANSVTLQTASVPVIRHVVDVREKAIAFLLELLKAAATDTERREIFHALHRAEYPGGRVEISNDMLNLTLKNTSEIVEVLLQEQTSLSYEIMQTLEHHYWLAYRRTLGILVSPARAECLEAASRLKTAIEKLIEKLNRDATFVKFKVLVGFESVFPYQWSSTSERKHDDHAEYDKYRDTEQKQYVDSISERNESEWFALIERIAAVQSNDLATFPPFARFLTLLAREKPDTILRLLDRASDRVRAFFAPILAGLEASGDNEAYQSTIASMLRGGRSLAALARHLRFAKSSDAHLAERLLRRTIEVQDDLAVAECLIMAMDVPPENVPSKAKFFVPAISYLNEKNSFWWVQAAWIVDEASSFFSSLTWDETALFLPAMIHARKIEYQSEQILTKMGSRYPDLVWKCFASRLMMKAEEMADWYEAIPYRFHGLEVELSKDASLAIDFGWQLFQRDSELFRFRGGRLLAIAFPSFPPNFADELGELATHATQAQAEFILAILQNYHGEEAIHDVLKCIIERFSDDERIRTDVIISLESSDGWIGEFGLVDLLRDKLGLIRKWEADPRPKVRNFAENQIRSIQIRIADEQRRAEERKALRELEYDQMDSKKN